MHISDVHDYSCAQVEEMEQKAKEYLTPEHEKLLSNAFYEVIDAEYNRLEENAAEFLENCAASRAETFLKRVLDGDEKAAMALLGDERGGDRHKQYGYDAGEPWAKMIHGNLFETSGIEMRRQIVEAHPDLIISERIKDLESIVEGLKLQIKKQDQEIERLRDRF